MDKEEVKTISEKSGAGTENDPEVTLEDHMAQARDALNSSGEVSSPRLRGMSDAVRNTIIDGTIGSLDSMVEEYKNNREDSNNEQNQGASAPVKDAIDEKVDAVMKALDESDALEAYRRDKWGRDYKQKVEDIIASKENHATDAASCARRVKGSNHDVVLALQIAEQKLAMAQALGEMSGDNPRYVVHGARLVCLYGTREARLVVPLDHGVCINSHPQLIIKDRKSLVNIKSFGNCTSINNSNMEAAAADAVRAFNVDNPKSIFSKDEPDISDELKNLCICECIPDLSESLKWSDGNEKHGINGETTLTQNAKIVCAHGGIIRIYRDGQDE